MSAVTWRPFARWMRAWRYVSAVLAEQYRWKRAVPRDLVRLWGGEPASLELIAAGKHGVFAFRAHGHDWVLKVAPSGQRGADSVAAEAEWVEFLAGVGVPVCRPLRSLSGAHVERFTVRGRELAAFAVERARGHVVTTEEVREWPPALVARWGAIAGRIHAASQRYHPSRGRPREMVSPLTVSIAEQILGTRTPSVERLAAVTESLQRLPRDPGSFGIVHGDLTPNNVFRDGDALTLFDFECSCVTWYSYDIAAPLFALFLVEGDPRIERAIARFFTDFMRGYLQENVLDPFLIDALPEFLQFRALLTTVLFEHQRLGRVATDVTRRIEAFADSELRYAVEYGAIYRQLLEEAA